MPRDLFGDVLASPAVLHPRRSSLLVGSIIVHGVAIVALIAVPLLAPGTLPTPQRALEFFSPPDMMTFVAPPPARPRTSAQPALSSTPGVPESAAPIIAPTGIQPETGLEPITTSGGRQGLPGIGTVEGVGDVGIREVEGPPPPPSTPVRVHGGIRVPQKIVDVTPRYPIIARQARVQGIVIVEATIDALGNVTAARVLRSVPHLDQAAVEAVRQWKYSPTLLNGVPVPVIMTVTVNFTLQDR